MGANKERRKATEEGNKKGVRRYREGLFLEGVKWRDEKKRGQKNYRKVEDKSARELKSRAIELQ
jgi:hypothetical protein